jgi:hypothetical protein
MSKLTNEDLAGTSYARACHALNLSPVTITGALGHTASAVDKTWKAALKAERNGDPMPSGSAHQWNLERELRLVAKRAFIQLRHFDVEIDRLSAARDALSAVLK